MVVQPLSVRFGIVVRNRRALSALTQEQIAERAGIHATYVGLVERGRRNCSIDIAAEIAKALGVPLSQLMEDAEAIGKKTTGTYRKGRQS